MVDKTKIIRSAANPLVSLINSKKHLKIYHKGSEWPWICGFCDLALFYELEFETHIKQHTEKSPFACPICSKLFSDNSRLCEHLVFQHLPSQDLAAISSQ